MDEKLQNAYDALQAAHDAGNTADATQIADYIDTLKAQQSSATAQADQPRTSAVLPALGGGLGAVTGAGVVGASKGVELVRALDRFGGNQQQTTGYNPRGSSVEESIQNWRTYADAQNEAAKSVRRDTALQKKYPGFTRPNLPHLQPTVPTAAENIFGHAANIGTMKPITGLTAGANAIDLMQQIKAGNPIQSTISAAGLAGSAAPYIKALPKKYRGVGAAVSMAAPVVNRALDQFTNPPEQQYNTGGLVALAEGGQPPNKLKKLLKSVPMPQTANLGLNLLLGLSDLKESHEDMQRNLQRGNYGSAANNLVDIGSTVSPYFLVPSIYQAGRGMSETATNQLASNPAYRQKMQDMSSTPMGGAIAGDTGLASQIMGQHEFEEDPGEYGHLLSGTTLPKYAGGKSVVKKAARMALDIGNAPDVSKTLSQIMLKPKAEMPLWEKFGYDPAKIAQDYPQTLHPVLATDEKTGKLYAQSVNSPEALAVQKARKAAMTQINKGNYEPFFDVSQRKYVDPSLYPLPERTLTTNVPKTEKAMEKHLAEAQNPEALQKWQEAFEKGSQRPDAKDWYAMGQLHDAFVKELGPEEGVKQFKARFADPMGATTGGANPTSNLMTAAYTNFLKEKGLPIPENTFEAPFPIGGRFMEGNLNAARKLHETGTLNPADTPKRYNFSSNFLGHLDRPTLDEQMMSAYGKTAPDKISYGLYENELNKLAAQNNVNPVNFQDVTWAGLKDYPGKPMMQEVNEMLARTSKITGEPQENVLKGFIRGDKPMYGLGAIGAGEAVNQDDAQPKKKGGKIKKKK